MAESLCNRCACGVFECEWMKSLTPVKGWKARKVRYKPQAGEAESYTYNVSECPKFKLMQERPVESVPRSTIQDIQADSAHQYQYLTERVKRVCVFGRKHFCDGEPNKGEGGKEAREPCDFYIKGKCTYPPIALLKAIQRKDC